MKRLLLFGFLLTSASGVVAALVGCPAIDNTGVLPITGVEIDINDLLTEANLGCGKGPGQVYKYAVVIPMEPDGGVGMPPAADTDLTKCSLGPFAGGVYDCFAPAVFGNLPLSGDAALPDGGSVTYYVKIYLFDFDTYERIENAHPHAIEESVSPSVSGDVQPICKYPYNWGTSCVGIEQSLIVVNAACNTVTLGPGSLHGGKDAGSDAPSEASEAAMTDGPGKETGSGEAGPEAGTGPDGGAEGSTDGGTG